jgi:hypothetical protein
MANVSIKLVLDNEIRRFSLPTQASYEELVGTVQTIVPSVYHTPALSFVDDESDVCSITNSLELQEAFRISTQVSVPTHFSWSHQVQSGRILRLQLSKPKISRPTQAIKRRSRSNGKPWKKFCATDFASSRSSCLLAMARRQAGQGHHLEALQFLEKAIHSGFKNTEELLADPAFEELRESEAFRALVYETKISKGPRDLFPVLPPYLLHVALMAEVRSMVPLIPPFTPLPVSSQRRRNFCRATSPASQTAKPVPPSSPQVDLMREIRTGISLKPVSRPPSSGRFALMRQIEQGPKLRPSLPPASHPTRPGRVALMCDVRNSSRSSIPAVALQVALMREVRSGISLKPVSRPPPSSRVALMKEIREGLPLKPSSPPSLKDTSLPTPPPLRVSLMKKINAGFALKPSPRPSPAYPRLAFLNEIQEGIPLKHVEVRPKPGRLAMVKTPYQPTTHLPFTSPMMREIRARVPLLN